MSGDSTYAKRHVPLVIVHTGDGKGKTTAAMGLALRTWSQGDSIGVFQFVKSGKWRTGEQMAFSTLFEHSPHFQGCEWESVGHGWSWSKSRLDEDQKAEAAQEGWRYIREGIANEKHRLWLLDEFTYPMIWGWIDVDEVVDVLSHRPGFQHVLITGRRCPEKIIECADLVTEMRKIKHPFDQGHRGQKGIEW